MAQRDTTILLGDMGAGKSALLNALAQKELFKAGFKLLSGMTEALDVQKGRDGNYYADIPGLDETGEEECKAAGEEITKALRIGGRYRVFFVVGNQHGRREKAEDVAIMEHILEKCPEIGAGEFGVIFNECEEEMMEAVDDPKAKEQFLAQTFRNMDRVTDYVIFLPKLPPKTIPNLDNLPGFARFVAQSPIVNLTPGGCGDMDFEGLQKILEQRKRLEKENDELVKDKKRHAQELEYIRAEYAAKLLGEAELKSTLVAQERLWKDLDRVQLEAQRREDNRRRMATQRREEDRMPHHEELLRPEVLFCSIRATPPATYELMSTTKAADIDTAYVEKVIGQRRLQDMSTGLSRVGLNCHQNTTEKVTRYTAELLRTFPDGHLYLIDGNNCSDFTTKADPHSRFDQLKQLMADDYVDEFNKVYGVFFNECEQNFESSQLGSIKDVFEKVGNCIGNLGSGEQVNPGEIGTLVSGVLSSLTEMSSRDLQDSQTDFIRIVEVDPKNPQKVKRFGAVQYEYSYTIKDYKDKKRETKQCHVKMTQRSCIFSNEEVFQDSYDKVLRQKASECWATGK